MTADEARATLRKPRSLADRITDQLRSAILDHEFQPGDRLAAEALAARFDVSPTPLREAFARLAGEGWVVSLPQRGVRVAEVSVQEMLEIYELRALLEPMALRRSVAQGNDAWRRELRDCFASMMELSSGRLADLDGPAYGEYEARHVHFHKASLSRCGSGWLIRITDLLTDQSRRYRRLSLPIREQFASVEAEHRAIVEACLEGDQESAAVAVIAHMDNTRRAMMDWSGQSVP
jgi:DNA-binding GntR family transcriptional regulator